MHRNSDYTHQDEEKNHYSILKKSITFLLFTSIYLGTQLSIVLAFSFAAQANMNEGIVSTIWAVTPLFGAIFDYACFRVRLSSKHLLGVCALVACAACISLSSLLKDSSPGDAALPTASVHPILPVIIAVIGSILMALRSFQGKQIVVTGIFDACDLTFGSLFFQGLLYFSALIYLRDLAELSLHYLVIGTVSSVLNTLGGVFIVKASSVGPLGPVNALFTSVSSILFCVIQFSRFGTLPNFLEVLGLSIGILGALILTIPDSLKLIGLRLFSTLGFRSSK